MSRAAILEKIRSALGRTPGKPPVDVPAPMLYPELLDYEQRIEAFTCSLEALAGKVIRVNDATEARHAVAEVLNGRSAIASNAPFLAECGIENIPGVQTGLTNRDALRNACAMAHVGITSADYALADTGTLVLLSSAQEPRMISLLPPVHVAVFPASILVGNLDELLSILYYPANQTSAMVFITGPSRTADIEQILVRGVHGPGEIYAVIAG
jgi:L-lactate dehydrogenase complex protein LldG